MTDSSAVLLRGHPPFRNLAGGPIGGRGEDCGNDYEMEAVADWGGYEECTPW